jgi:hypothetical protein
MLLSTPEATAIDLVRYPGHAGGWNNIADVLAGLAERIGPVRLAEAARLEGDLAAAQRVGFLFEHVGARDKTGPLAAWLEAERPRIVVLRPDRDAEGARKDRHWRILVNEEVVVTR